jgi:hypothetical protein
MTNTNSRPAPPNPWPELRELRVTCAEQQTEIARLRALGDQSLRAREILAAQIKVSEDRAEYRKQIADAALRLSRLLDARTIFSRHRKEIADARLVLRLTMDALYAYDNRVARMQPGNIAGLATINAAYAQQMQSDVLSSDLSNNLSQQDARAIQAFRDRPVDHGDKYTPKGND